MYESVCVRLCVSEISSMCGKPPSQMGEQATDSWTGGRGGGGGGRVPHWQPWLQLNQGLTLIPAPHTDTHEAERHSRKRSAADHSATLRVTDHHGFTARKPTGAK